MTRNIGDEIAQGMREAVDFEGGVINGAYIREAGDPALDSLREYGTLAIRTLAKDVGADVMLATLNAATGIASEAGEINEIVKKRFFHHHPHDAESIVHMTKELGDLLWYWNLMCAAYRLDPATVAAMNIEKLKKRYPDGFSTERSINRASGDI